MDVFCVRTQVFLIYNDFGSSNSGLFAHMTKQDNILYFTYKHTHIFPILILVFHAGLFAHVSKYLEACILRAYGDILYGFGLSMRYYLRILRTYWYAEILCNNLSTKALQHWIISKVLD